MVWRGGLLWMAALALVASCAPTPAITSSVEAYVDPPASELSGASPFVISVEPNPVAAGAEATLSVVDDGLPPASLVGVAAWWQCWNGSEWVDTYLVERGWHADKGTTIDLNSDVTMTIVDIGLPIPSSYPIIIPNVEPGIYRLRDEAGVAARDDRPSYSIPGFVIVRVNSAQ